MDRQAILTKITELMRELAENDDVVLTEGSTADDVEEWDSLLQVRLIVAIEAEYGIRFETKEITSPKNVGELIDLIEGKLSKR